MRQTHLDMTDDHLAALWADRLAAAPLPAPDASQLEAWLAVEPRREALLAAHRDLIASTSLRHAMANARATARIKIKPRGQGLAPWALAGAAVAAAVVVAAWPGSALKLETPQGRQRIQVLADGSSVTLNGDSEARVALARRARNIRLDRGEAFFKVAHDPSRPFTVHARDASVTALGTAFNVNRLADATEVTVREGKVRVVSAADPDRSAVVVAGESVRVSARGIEGRLRFDPAAAGDWRSGWIELNNGRLGDLVIELNRANARHPLRLSGPALAELRLTGRFRATAPRETARLVAATHGLTLSEAADGIILTPSN
ncbi:FecR domain-containing protein [Caulobacter segnis]|uniref:FecR family protein n=1 Tax=Caulobacter segnis TaxID=88688 RepID=UPI0028657518|nr:FecR domain-containing protein [Caulobacter segnis]MDR6624964.1 transmembrane sensor [Caulobacter segnis]